MRRRNHAAERVIEEFLTRILTQVLIQLRSDGLTEKGFALANPVAGQIKCANEGDEVESDRFWFGPYIRRQSTLTFHKITPGEGAGARFEQLDLHSGSMLTCPVDVSGARPGQLWCDATYRVPRRAI